MTPDGRLIAASFKTSSISEIDLESGRQTVLVGASTGANIGFPLDVVVSSNGSIYFSNVQTGTATLATAVYRVDPTTGVAVPSFTGQTFGPGTGELALSPDEKRLLVFGLGQLNLTPTGEVSSVVVDPITTGENGAVAFDCANNIYLTSHTDARVVNAIEILISGFPLGSDLAFGGPDGTAVLVVDQKTIAVVRTNVPGI
jgi:sugar lactone lactonase YvrE